MRKERKRCCAQCKCILGEKRRVECRAKSDTNAMALPQTAPSPAPFASVRVCAYVCVCGAHGSFNLQSEASCKAGPCAKLDRTIYACMHCGMYLGSADAVNRPPNIKRPDRAIASAQSWKPVKAFVFALTASKRVPHIHSVYGWRYASLKGL